MSNYLEQYSEKQLEENLKTILTLEYFGVHIEETKNLKDKFGLETIVAYFFTVPEFSTLEVEDNKLNERIKTAEGLISIAKEFLIEMVKHSLNDIFKDDEWILDSIFGDLESDVSRFAKFYARVRNSETWNKEMGDNAVERISNDIKKITGYKEV